ncbi:MAG: YbdD/YjiX family protein [Propionibacteriaceae bacterium]|nr:YbdD/YjiX family protein [Propionibacteriaceae bacterium]
MSPLDIARAVKWYVHSMMGDNAYAKYCAHMRAHHPETALPTEREFWRAKHHDAEMNPRARCC